MCRALSEELQPHRRGGRGDSCLGSELKGLASLSQLVSLFLRAQTVVSREEEETPARLGVWIPTNFILASICRPKLARLSFQHPVSDRQIHLLQSCKEDNQNHPCVLSPGHRGGADAAAKGSQTLSGNKGFRLRWPRRRPASLHGAPPWATPPSPAQMLSMEMKPSSFQGPSCFQ